MRFDDVTIGYFLLPHVSHNRFFVVGKMSASGRIFTLSVFLVWERPEIL